MTLATQGSQLLSALGAIVGLPDTNRHHDRALEMHSEVDGGSRGATPRASLLPRGPKGQPLDCSRLRYHAEHEAQHVQTLQQQRQP